MMPSNSKSKKIWRTTFSCSHVSSQLQYSNVENSKRKINCLKFERWMEIRTFKFEYSLKCYY